MDALVQDQSDIEVSLSETCSLLFEYTPEGKIVEVGFKMCLKTSGFDDNSPIVLSNKCTKEDSTWSWDDGALKLAHNGKCIHSFNSGLTPVAEGIKLVLFHGCDSLVNGFERMLATTPIPTITAIMSGRYDSINFSFSS